MHLIFFLEVELINLNSETKQKSNWIFVTENFLRVFFVSVFWGLELKAVF
jgi:hypothetical protein